MQKSLYNKVNDFNVNPKEHKVWTKITNSVNHHYSLELCKMYRTVLKTYKSQSRRFISMKNKATGEFPSRKLKRTIKLVIEIH